MRIAGVNPPGDHRADDGDDRSDREIDAFRADHHRHPQSDDRGRHRPVQNVDEVAEQAALDDADVEEPGRDEAVDREDERQRQKRPNRAMAGKRAQAMQARGSAAISPFARGRSAAVFVSTFEPGVTTLRPRWCG